MAARVRRAGSGGATDEASERIPLTSPGPRSSDPVVRWKREARSRVLLAFAFASMAGCLFGYDIGSTASVVTADQALADFDIRGNSWQQGALVSCSLYGALASSLLLFALGEVIGRRQEILVANAMYVLGSLGSVLPPAHTSYGVGVIIASRFAYGTGIGLTMHSAPAYIAETAPSDLRGLLIAMKEAAIVLGILLGYLAGSVFSYPGGWRVIWGSASLLAVVSFAGMVNQPESPRWLAGRDVARAGESLRHFRAGEDPEEELEGIVQAAKASSSSQTVSGKLAQVWEVRRAFFIGGGLLMLQQVSGQPAVLYFAPTIFQNAGLGAQSSKVASVLVGVVKLLSTVVASLKVDSFGRVPLLLCGVGLMFASLAALSLTTWLWTAQEGSRLVIFELMALVTAYQIGFGPISWLILTEVCPLRVRGNMVGLGVSVNFAFNVLAAQTLPVLTTALGMPGLFALYASVCLLSLAFIKAVVPETKGRTLEEIEDLLGLGTRDEPGAP
ncbi:MFS sugar transporter [Chloropicon roscoffensis]|uniref:MFS sugar transporter n=1 Tax=Chloropicon roscoffensis TaxID=1461544 RepID=A0AAX4NZQ4_9CHLO